MRRTDDGWLALALALAAALAATRLDAVRTAAVAAWSTALALLVGIPDDNLGSAEHVGLTLAVAGAGGTAIWLARARTERELDRERSRFLAEAGAALDKSLDYEATLRSVARLAVPRLADWCVIDMLDDSGRLRRLAVTHAQPEKESLGWELDRRYPAGPDDPLGAARVVRTRESQLFAEIPEEVLRSVAGDEEHLRILLELGLRSAAVAPLCTRGRVLGALTMIAAESGRRYGPDDLELLERLCDRVAQAIDNAQLYRTAREAERGTEEGRALLDTLFERAPVGLAYFDAALRYVRVNDALANMNGLSAQAHVGRTVDEVLPGMDPRVREGFEEVMATGEPMIDREVAGETPAAPGRRRTWLASYYPVRDAADAVVGLGAVVVEITDRKATEAALRRQKELYEALLRAQSDVGECVLIVSEGRVLYANPACERVSGYALHEISALPSLFDIVPDDERDALRERVGRLIRDEEVEPAYQTAILHRDGRRVDLEVAAKALPLDGAGQLVLVARDVTERRRAEAERARLLAGERDARAQAEDAQRRTAFLAEASARLDEALDLDHTFRAFTRLCVPFLGEVCSLDILAPSGEIERVAVAAVDPRQERVLEELAERYPIDPDGRHPVARALREGKRQPLVEMDAVYEEFARDDAHLELLRALAFHWAVVVPLRARGRMLGAITLARSAAGAPYEDADLVLLEDLALRASLAIDNARLYAERSYVADTLQSSLLPAELPSIPGVETAARYRAAGEATEVGGDFYDVFATRGERWAVLVGDVCGKGAEAAAITALARYTLRAGAMQGEAPSHALGLLNEALLRHGGQGEFCTVVHAALRAGGPGTIVTLAIGGHPLPLVLRAGGRVEPVGEGGTVLGVVPDPSLTDVEVALAPGDALVLYTDGVTEARLNGRMLGRDGLADLVADCAGLDAASIAERIETTVVQMEGGEPRDDIAVVVLRVAA